MIEIRAICRPDSVALSPQLHGGFYSWLFYLVRAVDYLSRLGDRVSATIVHVFGLRSV